MATKVYRNLTFKHQKATAAYHHHPGLALSVSLLTTSVPQYRGKADIVISQHVCVMGMSVSQQDNSQSL